MMINIPRSRGCSEDQHTQKEAEEMGQHGLDTLEEIRRAEAEETWMDHIMQPHGGPTAQEEEQEEWDPWKELDINGAAKERKESRQPEEEEVRSTRKEETGEEKTEMLNKAKGKRKDIAATGNVRAGTKEKLYNDFSWTKPADIYPKHRDFDPTIRARIDNCFWEVYAHDLFPALKW